jgi:hypothetical protein
MIRTVPSRLFFIIASVLILSITYLRNPSFARQKMFFEFENSLKANQFDPENYWQFRERFSPGSFTRNEENVDFFANFRITSVEDGLTPLFYYQSKNLRSLDALVPASSEDILKSFKKEFRGEVIVENDSYILIKENKKEYVFAFVKPTEEMQKVNGMFDYLPSERELLKEKYWYNTTYLNLD